MKPEESYNSTNKTCPKCGNDKGKNDQECTNCGIIYKRYDEIQRRKNIEKEQIAANIEIKKMRLEEEQLQAVKEEKIKEQSKPEKIFLIKKLLQPSVKKMVALVLSLIVFGSGALFYAKNKNKNDYLNNLRLANSVMSLSVITCVEMCDKYSTVWRESINNKYDSDFNDNIGEQRRKFEINGNIKKIDQSKELAGNLLQKLNQSTDLYPEAHKKIVVLYGVYSQLHSLAQSPSGSLMSYNKQVNDLQSEYIKVINEIRVLLPKEKE